MSAVGATSSGAHAKTPFSEVEPVADRPSDAVELHPFEMRLVYTALVDQILDQPSDRVVGERRHDRRIHSKTAFQASGDVVFTAAFPNLKTTRGVNASLAGIEPQHHLAERHYVPATLRLVFDLEKTH